MLTVLSGLPGTGKSAVAEEVARRSGAVWVSVDEIEDALLAAGLPAGWGTGVAAYEAARAAAQQNLALGRTVVVDAVNDSALARTTWRRAADAAGTAVLFVVLLPPDPAEHRRRLENRNRRLSRVPEPSWDQVVARAAAYEPWSEAHHVLDSASDVDELVTQVLDLMA